MPLFHIIHLDRDHTAADFDISDAHEAPTAEQAIAAFLDQLGVSDDGRWQATEVTGRLPRLP